jgi:hypothetical protein
MSARGTIWCGADVNATAVSMPKWHGFCARTVHHNEFKIFGFNGVDLVSSMLQMLVTLATLLYLFRNKMQARRDPTYGARLVLPVYERFLYAYMAATALAMCVHMIQSPNRDGGKINAWLCETFTPISVAVLVGLDWGLFHFVLEGVTFFMMQKGAGVRAFRRALRRSTLIGVALFFIAFISTWLQSVGSQTALLGAETESEIAQLMQLSMSMGLLVFYAVIRFARSTLFFRRPALRGYAQFWLVLRGLYLLAYTLRKLEFDIGFCCDVLAQNVVFSILSPIALFAALREDSEYWRGHTKGMQKEGSGHANLNLALVGRVSLNSGAASALAETLDTIKDDNGVRLLNFAYLNMELEEEGRLQVVGAGGTAKVYKGSYKGEMVAVKLVYPPELTQEDVTGFLAGGYSSANAL